MRKEKYYCQLALCYADGNMGVMYTSGSDMLKGPQDINGFPCDKVYKCTLTTVEELVTCQVQKYIPYLSKRQKNHFYACI